MKLKNNKNFIYKLAVLVFLLLVNNKTFSNEKNYVIATIDRVPITLIDLKEKAKLIYFFRNKKNDYKNINKYFEISLNELISDNLLIKKAEQFNKNILQLTKRDAEKFILARHQNSSKVLNRFLTKNGLSSEVYISKIQIEIIKKFLIGKMFQKEYDDYLNEINEITKKNKSADKIDIEQILVKGKVNNTKIINNVEKQINNLSANGYSFKEIANIISKNKNIKVSAGRSGWQGKKGFRENTFNKLLQLPEGEIIKEKGKQNLNYLRIISKRIEGKFSNREQIIDLIRISYLNSSKNKMNLENLKKTISNASCKDIYSRLNKIKTIKVDFQKINLTNFSEKILTMILNTNVKEFTDDLILNKESIMFYICEKSLTDKPNSDGKQYDKQVMKKVNVLTKKILKILKKDAIIDIKININELT